jgi:hypothetical protein
MPVFKTLVALSLAAGAVFLAACADGTGPLPSGGSMDPAPTGVMSAAKTTTRTTSPTDGSTTTSTTTTTQSGSLGFLPGSPRLRTYDTTFVAHQGWQQSFVIFHTDGNYFMVLDVPSSAQFVDANGNPVPPGAVVNLRARVDSTSVSFEFGPHGSYFTGSRPVVLWVYLKYVALGSGLPAIWYQADATQPWAQLSTTADKAGNWLKIELQHFSNYAVAYRK